MTDAQPSARTPPLDDLRTYDQRVAYLLKAPAGTVVGVHNVKTGAVELTYLYRPPTYKAEGHQP